jgi:hypothetical protein
MGTLFFLRLYVLHMGPRVEESSVAIAVFVVNKQINGALVANAIFAKVGAIGIITGDVAL